MFVADIGITDLPKLFEMRVVLESLAARAAARRGRPEHWQRMSAVLAQLPHPDHPDYNEAMITVDQSCHEIIYKAADNPFLADTLTTHYALSLRLWYYFLNEIGDMRGAILEHQQVLEALRERDGEEAARLMGEHIQAFQEEIQAVMVRG
jgi:DNA-binding GntR family transcriptional regulator